MKPAMAVLGASFVLAGCAAGPKEADHAHHAPGAAAVASAAPTPGHMDSMMKSMQEMHDRMSAAQTPEERAKLLQEHMKLMLEHLAMMGRMHGGKGGMGLGHGMPMSPEMMGKRMDMMEMMMKTMLAREAMKAPAAK